MALERKVKSRMVQLAHLPTFQVKMVSIYSLYWHPEIRYIPLRNTRAMITDGIPGQDYYGIYPGVAGYSFITYDLTVSGAGSCNGVYQIAVDNSGRYPQAQIALDCGGSTNAKVTANFRWISPSGTPLTCVFLNLNNGAGNFDPFCGPTQSAASTCALAAAATIPGSTVSSPGDTFRFVPT